MSVIADILEAKANVPKVFQAGYEEGAKSGAGTQYVNQYFSNALVGRASGEAVRCEVSPIEHELDVKVELPNLIPYPYTTKDTNIEGISFTYNGRTVVVEGESGDTPIVNFEFGNVELEAGTYTIGGFSLHVGADPDFIRLNVEDSATGDNIITRNIGNVEDYKGTFELSKKTNVKIWIRFGDTSSHGTMTPYLVKEDMSGVKLLRYGKNLCDVYGFSTAGIPTKDSTRYISGSFGTTISTTDPADSVTVTQTNYNGNDDNATVYQNGYFCVGVNRRIAEGTQVTVSFDVLITKKLGNPILMSILPNGIFGTSFYTPDVGVKTRVVLPITWRTHEQRQYLEIRNSGCSATFSNFQIELGKVATEYEPYIEPTEHTPNEDGTVEGVMSVYPVTTLMTNTDGVTIDATYNKDANKVVASLEERIAALETAIVSQ